MLSRQCVLHVCPQQCPACLCITSTTIIIPPQIPEDSCSLVVSKAVELWEDQGSLLATPDLTPDLTTTYSGTTATILSSRSSSSSAVLRDTDEIT